MAFAVWFGAATPAWMYASPPAGADGGRRGGPRRREARGAREGAVMPPAVPFAVPSEVADLQVNDRKGQ